MKLYLFNQKRNRDLDVYLEKLNITPEIYDVLNCIDKKVLLIGGGFSLLEPLFVTETIMEIINIDLDPPKQDSLPRLKNVKGDFTQNEDYINIFDEVWALYSLPLYSPDKYSVFMFVFKAILAIKETGVVRFFPLEYDRSSKLHTKDADYDMTTMECTNNVIEALDYVKKIGVESVQKVFNSIDEDRVEALVTLYINPQKTSKKKINDVLLKRITDYKDVNRTQSSVTIVLKNDDW